jgi:starvation-inducible DNA-binding protein
MPKLNPTKHDLPKIARAAMVDLLNAGLADAVHLALQAKQAHWNVKGPHFLPLHELFDKLYAEAGDWADLLAERAVQLGGTAEGTLASVADRTRLPAYKLGTAAGDAHLKAMVASVSAFGASVRAAIDEADKAGDAGTADLFTEISRSVDKMLWFLEAHLAAK